MMKERYIALMERTLSAYTDDHIREYFARVQAEGLTEHGFPRLTANIGILLCQHLGHAGTLGRQRHQQIFLVTPRQ